MIDESYRDIMHDWTLECGCNTTIFPFKMGLEEVFSQSENRKHKIKMHKLKFHLKCKLYKCGCT